MHRSYTQGLIAALGHPIREVRMRAIIALGLRRAREACDALVECALRNRRDPVEGLEIVRSLRRILEDDPIEEALRRLAHDHPSRIVRDAAREAVAGNRALRAGTAGSRRQSSGCRTD